MNKLCHKKYQVQIILEVAGDFRRALAYGKNPFSPCYGDLTNIEEGSSN